MTLVSEADITTLDVGAVANATRVTRLPGLNPSAGSGDLEFCCRSDGILARYPAQLPE